MGDPMTLLKLGAKYVAVGDGEAALPAVIRRELYGEGAAPSNTLFVGGGRIKAGPKVFTALIHPTYSVKLGAHPPIEIMRSCGYRCAFCATRLHGPVRYRPAEELAKRYAAVGKRDIRFIAPVGFLYWSRDGRMSDAGSLVSLLEAVGGSAEGPTWALPPQRQGLRR